MKKALALVLAGVMALSLAACGSTPSSTATSGGDSTGTSTPAAAGKVYYLNFKPEQD